MDASSALLAGLAGGLAVAMQIGAVSLLLIETSLVAGPRAGAAAGLGVATIDLAYAVLATAAGGAAGAALSAHEDGIRIAAALVLAAVTVPGLVRLLATGRGVDAPARPRALAVADPARLYARFVAITAANPLTIVSFVAMAAALAPDGTLAAAAFAAGVGAASAGWHLVLTMTAGRLGRRVTPAIRRGLAVAGRVAVLAIAAHLATG